MDQLAKEDLLLEVASIWHHEQQAYHTGKNSLAFYQDLHHYLSFFYLLKGHRPFVSQEMVSADPSLLAYYERYVHRYQAQRDWLLDYFEHGGAFYDMNVPCVIERGDVSPQHYTRLFALKLRQFEEDAEALSGFLSFHYYQTFAKSSKPYSQLLQSLEGQSDIVSSQLLQQLALWRVVAMHTLSKEDPFALDEDNGRLPEAWFRSLELGDGLEEPVLSLSEEEEEPAEEKGTEAVSSDERKTVVRQPFLRPGPIEAENSWTEDEIRHFFSFLYKERGDGEGSYLKAEEVERMLAGGLVIPALPLSEKFRLAFSQRYPRKVVDQFIHAFILAYNKGEKRRLLQFFGSYIHEYRNALDRDGLVTLGKNVTGEKPTKGTRALLQLSDYLPQRFQ